MVYIVSSPSSLPPAGFGKTTLPSELIAGFERPFAWLLLETSIAELDVKQYYSLPVSDWEAKFEETVFGQSCSSSRLLVGRVYRCT